MSRLLHAQSLRAGLLCVGLFLAPLPFCANASATSLDPLAEYKIKAAYLYNFTKFIEWPPTAFSQDQSPYVIGILEIDHTVSSAISEVLRGKTTAKGRPIEIRSAQSGQALADCHIVFVTRGASTAPSDIPVPKDRPVLLVGESSGFAQVGGTINFLTSGDAIRLEINPQRAERVGLRLSGTLASIGMLVRDREMKP